MHIMAVRLPPQSFTQAIHGRSVALVKAIEVTDMLLLGLKDRNVLTAAHVDDIKGCNVDYKKGIELLRILEKRDNMMLPDFVAALANDGQEHVVREYFSEYFSQAASSRFVHLGTQTNDCSKDYANSASQTDYSFNDLLALIKSELLHLLYKNQQPVDAQVQTESIFPPVSACRLRATKAVQAHVKQRAVETQTDGSFSDYCATSCQVPQNQFAYLPVELLEIVLIRTFKRKFTDHYKGHYMTYEPPESAYSSLAAVCYNWWQTLNGWEESPTRHWLRHKILRAFHFVTRPYLPWPCQIQPSLHTVSPIVGITVWDNKLFVVLTGSDSIRVFGPDNHLLRTIKIKQLREPYDIVVCCETEQLYVAGEGHSYTSHCVWEVPISGKPVVKWLPNKITRTAQFKPLSLSVNSRRLLVTSQCNGLMMFAADGRVLERVPVPGKYLLHAVESSRGTFIISHWDKHTHRQVCEINSDGHVTRIYSGQLSRPDYLSLDSDGRVFVADTFNNRILLLNSSLELDRIILDKECHSLLPGPRRLHYDEQTGQLYVVATSDNYAQIFQVR